MEFYHFQVTDVFKINISKQSWQLIFLFCFNRNMEIGFQKIKQPAPSVSSNTTAVDSEGNKYKVIPATFNDVIQVPNMTSTPLGDWVEIKRKENPYMKYKIKDKTPTIKGFNTVLGLTVFICGVISCFKLFKK